MVVKRLFSGSKFAVFHTFNRNNYNRKVLYKELHGIIQNHIECCQIGSF